MSGRFGEERTMDLEQRIAAALGAADVTPTDLATLMPDEVVSAVSNLLTASIKSAGE